jgi:hypothetical protein
MWKSYSVPGVPIQDTESFRNKGDMKKTLAVFDSYFTAIPASPEI